MVRLLAILLIASAACSNVLDPSGLHVSFEKKLLPLSRTEFTAEGGERLIRVIGYYETGKCNRERPRAELRGRVVTFRLQLIEKRDLLRGCASPALTYDYVALIHGVEPGTYLLRVEHFGADDSNGLLLEKEVTVR